MELKNKIEALLFASGRKMSLEEIGKLVKIKDSAILKKELIELKKEYQERSSPVIVIEDDDGWKLTTHEEHVALVRQINPHTELSKTMMETLAVVAWKQPMLQSDVIKIRTNKAYDHIKELMDMGFLVKERYGRTYLLKLSQKFFEYFDVRNDDSLKSLFKDIKEEVVDQKQMSDFNEGDEQVSNESEETTDEIETPNENEPKIVKENNEEPLISEKEETETPNENENPPVVEEPSEEKHEESLISEEEEKETPNENEHPPVVEENPVEEEPEQEPATEEQNTEEEKEEETTVEDSNQEDKEESENQETEEKHEDL